MTFSGEISEASNWLLEIQVSHITDLGVEESDPAIFQVVSTETSLQISDVAMQGPTGPAGLPGAPGDHVVCLAGQTLSGHRLVTTAEDGRLVYASADLPEHLFSPVWLTTNAAVEGEEITVSTRGLLEEPSWSWIPRSRLYLGLQGHILQSPSVSGALFVRLIGSAVTTESIYFDPFPPISFLDV